MTTPLPRPLTDDEIIWAHRLWDRRLNTRDIASALGVYESVVYRYIEFVKHGVAPSKATVHA